MKEGELSFYATLPAMSLERSPFCPHLSFPFCFKCKNPIWRFCANHQPCSITLNSLPVHLIMYMRCVCVCVSDSLPLGLTGGSSEPMKPQLLRTPAFLLGPSPSRKHKCPNLAEQLGRPQVTKQSRSRGSQFLYAPGTWKPLECLFSVRFFSLLFYY